MFRTSLMAVSPFFVDLARYLQETALSTLAILGILGLPILLSCTVLYLLASWQSRMLTESFGWHGLLITGWLGAPVHEISHALAALVFGHQIKKIQLFKPDKGTGQLGLVEHTYNPKNPYAAILGNAVIPMAPFLGGAAAIFLLTLLAAPELLPLGPMPGLAAASANTDFSPQTLYQPLLEQSWGYLKHLYRTILEREVWKRWVFYAYLYGVFCIAMHLAPSGQDFKNFWWPALVTALLVFLANVGLRAFGDVTWPVIRFFWKPMVALAGLLSIAIVISLAGTLAVLAISTLVLRGRRG